MSGELDVIKEYLVSIGFAINAAQYNDINKKLSGMGPLVKHQTDSIAKNMMAASKYITAAITSVTTAIGGMVAQNAKAEIGYEKFGRQMWMNTRVAKDFKIALDAMGESMEDIAWNPELRGQFKELMALSQKLRTPDDASGQFKGIREILFTFKQLKVEVKYATEWISYYLTKYFDGPLKNIKKTLTELHKNIVLNMPVWTKRIAEFFATFLMVGKHAIQAIRDIWIWLTKIWDGFSPGTKKVILALGALFTFINLSPLGRIITALSALLLLIDDYYGWKEGRKSALGEIWKELDAPLMTLGDSIKEISEAIGEVIDLTLRMFGIYDGNQSTKMQQFWKYIGSAVDNIADQIKIIALGTKVLTGLFTLPWDKKGNEEYKKLQNEFLDAIKHSAKQWHWTGDNSNNNGGDWDGSVGYSGTKVKPLSKTVLNRLKPYDKTIEEAAKKYNVPVDLIRRVIQQESQGKQSARSKAGAIGLMQLMPGTAKGLGVNPYNANQNIMGGVQYLAQMYKKFGSWEKALAAYNAGPGNVQKYGGIPPFKETLGYLKNILGTPNFDHLQNNSYLTPGRSGNGTGQSLVSFGDIIVNVPNTNASPQEIASAVEQKITKLDGVRVTRKIRDLSGVTV